MAEVSLAFIARAGSGQPGSTMILQDP